MRSKIKDDNDIKYCESWWYWERFRKIVKSYLKEIKRYVENPKKELISKAIKYGILIYFIVKNTN